MSQCGPPGLYRVVSSGAPRQIPPSTSHLAHSLVAALPSSELALLALHKTMAETYNAPAAPAQGPTHSVVLAISPEQMERAMAIRCVQESVRRASESATQIYDSPRRHKVFVEEQGYAAEIEVDALDPLCDHLLMTQTEPDGTTTDIGTLRFYPPKLKLGRVAILPAYRGGGRGKLLLEALEEHVRERRGKTGDVVRGKKAAQLLAHAQVPSLPFYEKTGWATFGCEFLEEGTPHIKVVKRIELVPECVGAPRARCPVSSELTTRARPADQQRPRSKTLARPIRTKFSCAKRRPTLTAASSAGSPSLSTSRGTRWRTSLTSASLGPPPPATRPRTNPLRARDRKDPESDHLIMYRVGANGEHEDAGTIRWWPKPGQPAGKPAGKLGRVCGASSPSRRENLALSNSHIHARTVLPKFRGGGTGKILMQALEAHLRARKGKAGVALRGEKSVRVLVHSQLHAEGFYARAGYVREGGQFMEDGAPHCLLVKELELVPEEA